MCVRCPTDVAKDSFWNRRLSGSARLSRAGFGVLAETIFKSPRSRDGFANTREACATLATYALQKRFALAISI
ncbi:MAG: hypothetical protein DME43_14230 [Verrucomicrobia bacterium]|nr:MAG: hypothetical protein DME43_14230 [Verrucomicrobiota bacterium]